MKQHTKLSQKQEHVAEQQAQANTAKEFSNSDELLRFDAAQTPVPPEIAERLKHSSSECAPAARPGWLKRIFGGK
jgi:hypothetical protein